MTRACPSDPSQSGLWAALVSGGVIRNGAWENAAATGEVVGNCRACGSYLVPDDPPSYGERPALPWFVARCLDCGREVASPGGRVLRRSGRLSERGHG